MKKQSRAPYIQRILEDNEKMIKLTRAELKKLQATQRNWKKQHSHSNIVWERILQSERNPDLEDIYGL